MTRLDSLQFMSAVVEAEAQERATVSLFEIGEIEIIQRSMLSRWLLLHSQEHVYSYLAI